jgi:hypothetical protein
MSDRYPGGLITKTPVEPDGPYENGAAPGIWTLEQQAYWKAQGLWPIAGNADPSAFIENLFSTYLYVGNGTTQTITNGIDLAGKGGLVWIKSRSAATNHFLFDTVRGTTDELNSNTTDAEASLANSLTAFNSNGFSIGSATGIGVNAATYASWTFRKQPKFFDVVTYTGDGSATRDISHSLGSVPGCIIIKRTDSTGDWLVRHRSLYDWQSYLNLNLTSAEASSTYGVAPTETTFNVGFNISPRVYNNSGATYVAYLFAHDAGGFGEAGTDNVISCGSFTTDSNGNYSVNLGYEPQWVLIKRSDSTSNWYVWDVMRGMPVDNSGRVLYPNLSNAEANFSAAKPSATGFYTDSNAFAGNATYIYIAIRRPMKPPTTGTEVFSPNLSSAATPTEISTGFPIDMQIIKFTADSGYNGALSDRLRGVVTTPTDSYSPRLVPNSSAAEESGVDYDTRYWNNTGFQIPGSWSGSSSIYWSFKRAPGFFDQVCYTGTGSQLTVNHNLTVAPELVIIKNRTTAGYAWGVYCAFNSDSNGLLRLNSSLSGTNNDGVYMLGDGTNMIPPTSTTMSIYGPDGVANDSGNNYVAYLFATVAGVSKVGSYTGTGTTNSINCGFSGGARFVMIKRTDSTGDWYVWDSARGIVAGDDPYLLMNSTAAEVTNTDYVDTYASGFEITSTAPAAINANGGTFIFLAIA